MADTTFSLAQLGVQPITPEAPSGISARYEPEYERLEAEIAKLSTLTPQGEAQPVDWGRVVDLSGIILQAKSKDLLVASYLSCGLFEQQGYAGLEIAFTIYRDLLATYWDTLFPEKRRLRARLAAIAWLAERLGRALERRVPGAPDYGAVQHCHTLINEMDALLDEKLSDLPAAERQQLLSPLPGRLARMQAGIEPPAPSSSPATLPAAEQSRATAEEQRPTEPVSPTNAVAPPVPGAAAAPPAPPPAVAPPVVPTRASQATPPAVPAASAVPVPLSTEFAAESDAQKALRDCQTVFRNAAAFLLGKNLANPLPYRLSRLGTWMLVLQPPLNQDNVTQLPRVQPATVQRYTDALQKGEHASLILEVEAGLARAPFWLDAHRYTAMALDALGPSYAQARRAVIDELAGFLGRVPGVLDLKFADGTPCADDQTRLWIDSAVRPPAPARRLVASVASSDNGAPPPAWEEMAREARQLAGKGRVLDAAALFQSGLQQAASQRERFVWRLQQARFCVEAALLEVAVPQLEFLGEQAERFALEEWEPCLSLESSQLLLECYYKLMQKTKNPPADLVEKTQRLHTRLCRLDVTAVLALDGKT